MHCLFPCLYILSLLVLGKPASPMEQLHYKWVVDEQEEQEQELQDAALKGRQSMQH